MDQAIEGGIQARITKPGFDKISSLIPQLVSQNLNNGEVACIPGGGTDVKLLGFIDLASLHYCSNNACQGGKTGCPVDLTVNSTNLSMADNPQKAILDAALNFTVNASANLDVKLGCVFGVCIYSDNCTLKLDFPNLLVDVNIIFDTDPVTGALKLAVDSFNNLQLHIDAQGNSGLCSIAAQGFNALDQIFNLTNLIGGIIGNLFLGPVNQLIQGLLPNPPGLVGSINTGAALASMGAPKDASLEALVVAGGYVSAKNGGLNLGTITGINSDRDQTTRAAGPDPINSEPSLCVPARPAPVLGMPPWNLTTNPSRNDYFLDVAPEFSGTPDPMDSQGNTQDIALGVSRTFLDLLGFHLYNSGTLCLSISGNVLSQLNAGTVSVLIPSLGNILENRKAPLAIVLRPQQPLLFTLGAGTAKDPLINVHATDMRIDFYAFLEERYARIFTLSLDMTVGVNLMTTTDKDGNPAIAPMITGIDKSSVQARVTNTDLLQEDPNKLAKSLLGLIDVAVGAIMGGVQPITLPSFSGFRMDNLELSRVQTRMDDFLAIYGSLVQDPNGMPFPMPADIIPMKRPLEGVRTTAKVVDVSVPPPDIIRENVLAGNLTAGNVPSVTLELGGSSPPGASGGQLEWQYRVDGSVWHDYTDDPHLTIADPAFQLQAKHTIDVRARVKGDWTTVDPTPEHLMVTIDSVPPELNLAVENDKKDIAFKGWDNVSDDDALRYSWKTPTGWTTPGHKDFIDFEDAWAATEQGTTPLLVRAYDEQGNYSEQQQDLKPITYFHGRTTNPQTSTGCGCTVGGANRDNGGGKLALLSLLPLLGLLGLRRRRHRTTARRGR